jgi:hypothetical protein
VTAGFHTVSIALCQPASEVEYYYVVAMKRIELKALSEYGFSPQEGSEK